MKQRNVQHSKVIQSVAALTAIGFVVLGVFIGAFCGSLAAARSSQSERLLGLFLGALIGMGVGYFISLPICALLNGFARIVAWYEAVPPGQVYVVNSDGSAAPVMPAPSVPSGVTGSTAVWDCACGARWPASRGTCETCGRSKPSAAPIFSESQSQPIFTDNSKQQAPAFDNVRKQASSAVDQMKGWLKSKQDAAGSWLNSKVSTIVAQSQQADKWTCTCGASNHMSKGTCEICGAAKPSREQLAVQAAPAAAAKKTAPAPGSWTCTCGAQWPAHRGTCENCGERKPR